MSRALHAAWFSAQRQLLVEDTPDQLRGRLRGGILELRGSSLALMRRVAEEIRTWKMCRCSATVAHIRVRKGKDARY